MFDGLKNNRVNWKEQADVHAAKMAKIAEEKQKLEDADKKGN